MYELARNSAQVWLPEFPPNSPEEGLAVALSRLREQIAEIQAETQAETQL